MRFGESGWKERYYQVKLHMGRSDREMCRYVVGCYVQGLCWVLMYYYQGVQDWSGSDVLLVSVSDLGNTGSGDVLVTEATVAIAVAAVNDAPTVVVPAGVMKAVEDTTVSVDSIVVALQGDAPASAPEPLDESPAQVAEAAAPAKPPR